MTMFSVDHPFEKIWPHGICGRPHGKHFLALRTIWSAAVICPASVCAEQMSAGPDEVRRRTAPSYVDGPMASTFWRFELFGRLRSYVRPLFVRNRCPRALMKSDDRGPYQWGELCARDE